MINNINYKATVSLSLSAAARGEGITVIPRMLESEPDFPFLSPIEEGINEAAQMGPIKGFPLTDIRAEILKATYDNPDFARLTLKMAAYEGFQEGLPRRGPLAARPHNVPHGDRTERIPGRNHRRPPFEKVSDHEYHRPGQGYGGTGPRPPHEDVRLFHRYPFPFSGPGCLYDLLLPLRPHRK